MSLRAIYLPGMSYLIRRLLENTANSSFLRQSSEDRPIEELLAAPVTNGKDVLVYDRVFPQCRRY